MRRVILETPCYDWKLDVEYVNAMLDTTRAAPKDVAIFPLFSPGDSWVGRVRNYLFDLAMKAFDGEGPDDLFLIDADTVWTPAGFYKLLDSPHEIVCGIQRIKTDAELKWNFRPKKGAKTEDGVVEADFGGTAFMRISRAGMQRLWKKARPYTNGAAKGRWVFQEYVDRQGELVSEDVGMCYFFRSLGGKIHVDTSVMCGHAGRKLYTLGNAPTNGPKPVQEMVRQG